MSTPTLTIHYEDEWLLVVEKPAGMPCLPAKDGISPTLADFFPGYELVHRLDNDTSGLVVIAKTAASEEKLRAQFSEPLATNVKEYTALVVGDPPDEGTIDFPVAHHPRKKKKMVVCPSTNVRAQHAAPLLKARKAVTHFATLKRYGAYTLLRVTITTGVRHQIRVHLASAGFPIAGDRLYQNSKKRADDTLPLDRHFLHASRLVLSHPVTSETIECVSELPRELQAVLRKTMVKR